MSAADQLPDEILQLILDDEKARAVQTLRHDTGVDLVTAKNLVWQAEEDLGLLQDGQCPTCEGKGTIRVRKAEYDPTGRHAEYRKDT